MTCFGRAGLSVGSYNRKQKYVHVFRVALYLAGRLSTYMANRTLRVRFNARSVTAGDADTGLRVINSMVETRLRAKRRIALNMFKYLEETSTVRFVSRL